jgi:hypothetical protein
MILPFVRYFVERYGCNRAVVFGEIFSHAIAQVCPGLQIHQLPRRNHAPSHKVFASAIVIDPDCDLDADYLNRPDLLGGARAAILVFWALGQMKPKELARALDVRGIKVAFTGRTPASFRGSALVAIH